MPLTNTANFGNLFNFETRANENSPEGITTSVQAQVAECLSREFCRIEEAIKKIANGNPENAANYLKAIQEVFAQLPNELRIKKTPDDNIDISLTDNGLQESFLKIAATMEILGIISEKKTEKMREIEALRRKRENLRIELADLKEKQDRTTEESARISRLERTIKESPAESKIGNKEASMRKLEAATSRILTSGIDTLPKFLKLLEDLVSCDILDKTTYENLKNFMSNPDPKSFSATIKYMMQNSESKAKEGLLTPKRKFYALLTGCFVALFLIALQEWRYNPSIKAWRLGQMDTSEMERYIMEHFHAESASDAKEIMIDGIFRRLIEEITKAEPMMKELQGFSYLPTIPISSAEFNIDDLKKSPFQTKQLIMGRGTILEIVKYKAHWNLKLVDGAYIMVNLSFEKLPELNGLYRIPILVGDPEKPLTPDNILNTGKPERISR